ncbi:TPA: paraquat-inducible protein A [Klebsiella pneumoniae]|uniref:paraquat-inducible protein A n=1 Tax=Enterobacterales TaxID=91347 RepID=UPI0018A29E9B|nr:MULTISPECIES: paraquat-inducible protein A [Enterobacterales]HCB0391664.1 paraquat-inducible protein A [Klebsiella pneumoniae]
MTKKLYVSESLAVFPDLVVCEHCDSVYRRIALTSDEVARCDQCAAILYRANRLDVDRWLALTLTAAILAVIANVCPVVRISLQGLHNEATLWQSAAALAHGPASPIAVPTAISIIVAPLIQIGLLAWVLTYARMGRRAPGFAQAMRILVMLRPWSMIEVGLLGILVAVIKLSSFLQVAPGPGIWATAGLMLLITLIANRDVHWLWDLTEYNRPRKAALV